MHVLAAIIDNAVDVNWLGMFKARLMDEHKKFETDKTRNLVRLKKKITMLHKVIVILCDKLPDHDWEKSAMKSYQPVHKAILLVDEPLPPPANDDMTPTPIKPKAKKAKAASFVQSEAQPAKQKKSLKRKELAKKPAQAVEQAAPETPAPKKPKFTIKYRKVPSMQEKQTHLRDEPSEEEVGEEPEVAEGGATEREIAEGSEGEGSTEPPDSVPISAFYGKKCVVIRSPSTQSKIPSCSPTHSPAHSPIINVPSPTQPETQP